MTARSSLTCVTLIALLWLAPVAAADDDAPATAHATEWGAPVGGLRMRVTVPSTIEQGAPLAVRVEMWCDKDGGREGITHLNTVLPDAFLRLELRRAGTPPDWGDPAITVRPHDPTFGMPFTFEDAAGRPVPLDGLVLLPIETSFPMATAWSALGLGAYRATVVFEFPGSRASWPAPIAEREIAGMWAGTMRSVEFGIEITKQPPRTETFRLPTRLRLRPGLRVGYGAADAEDVELTSRNGMFLTTEYSRNGEMFALMGGAPEPDDVNAIDAWQGHSGALDVTYGIRILATADRPGHLWRPGQGGTTCVLWKREIVLRADAAEVAELGGETRVETHPADAPLPENAILRLGSTRLRHPGHISSVACSPDGRLVASCSQHPARVRIWESATGRLVHELGEVGMSLSNVVFSADGSLLATGEFDGHARIWSAGSGELVRAIALLPRERGGSWGMGSIDRNRVNALALSPGGDLLALGGRAHATVYGADGEEPQQVTAHLAIVEVATGRVVRRIEAFAWQGMEGVAFSPDGTLLATADGAAVRLWEMETGSVRRTFDTGDREPDRIEFGKDGTWLLIGSKSGLTVYDVATGTQIVDLGSQGGQRFGVTLLGDRVAASGWKTIRLWDADTWKPVRTFDASWHQMTAISGSQDGSVLASGCGNSVRLWDTDWFNETVSFDGHRGPVGHVAFSPDGSAIATGSDDGAVRLWDAADGARRGDPDEHDRGVTSLVFRPDGGVLASAGNDQAVNLRLLDGGSSPPLVRPSVYGTEALAFSPDGKTLAIGGRDGTVILWDVAAGGRTRRRDRVAGDGGMVTALAFAPDGKRLAAAHSNGVLHVLNGTTLEVHVNWTIDAHWATDLAWSPEGNRIVAAFHDGSVRTLDAWDVENVRVLATSARPATGVAWSHANPSRIATAGDDGSVRLLDPQTGAELARFEGHDGPVLDVAFSPDGRRLVTGGADTTALVWRVPTR